MDGYLRQATASQVRWIGPFLDDTDFKTAETGLTVANTDIKLSKNGGASASKNSGGGTHDVNGMYALTWDATDSATVGELKYSVKVAGALPVFGAYVVLEEAVYDALFAASAPGYLQPTTPGRLLDVSAGGEAGIDWANIGSPTTTQDLNGTTIKTTQVVASVTGAVGSVTGNVNGNVGSVAGNVNGTVASVVGAVGSVTGNVNGNVTGTVGSVIGAVGSVTGNVNGNVGSVAGNVNGSVASVVGAVGSVTGNVNGNVTGTVGSVVGAVGSVTGNVNGSVNSVVGSIGSIASGGIAAAAFASGAITAASIATDAIGSAELAADAVAEIADQVWDEILSGHAGVGSTGAALSAAGGSGDPWATALPGSYGAGTAGKIVGDNIDATITSRLASAGYTAPDNATITAISALLTTVAGYVDTEVAAILADTTTIKTRIPAALVSGRIDASVGAMAANTVTASALAADAVDEILDDAVGDGSITVRQALRILIAGMAGKLSGAATTTVTIRNLADSADVVVATVDADGNRSAVTVTP